MQYGSPHGSSELVFRQQIWYSSRLPCSAKDLQSAADDVRWLFQQPSDVAFYVFFVIRTEMFYSLPALFCC